jgi:hypothetical protein
VKGAKLGTVRFGWLLGWAGVGLSEVNWRRMNLT